MELSRAIWQEVSVASKYAACHGLASAKWQMKAK